VNCGPFHDILKPTEHPEKNSVSEKKKNAKMTKRKREAETPDVAVDHYKILEVEKNAKEEELRRSYKRLAMKWHPDKNLTNKEEAESMFKKVSEAYEVSFPRRVSQRFKRFNL